MRRRAHCWSRRDWRRWMRTANRRRLGWCDIYSHVAKALEVGAIDRWLPRNNSRTTNATAPRCEVRP